MCNEIGTEQIVPKFMTIPELSKYSGISTGRIRKMVKNGEVDYFRPGSKTFVTVKSPGGWTPMG